MDETNAANRRLVETLIDALKDAQILNLRNEAYILAILIGAILDGSTIRLASLISDNYRPQRKVADG